MKAILISIMLFACGCTTITVDTTHEWEGHYMSKDAVIEAAKDINLKKGESVWMLSNTTLYKLLKKEGKTK